MSIIKKVIKTICISAGIIASLSMVAFADIGQPVTGISEGNTKYTGHVEGQATSVGCYGATYTIREPGTESVRAYVEIVTGDGYKIGSGQAGIGVSSAYSGTISYSGGKNAYGSVGTAISNSAVFCALY